MFRKNRINIEALCAAPPEALAHSPSQMPLSCLVAPLSQRELHKDGGGSGVGEWRGEEGAQRPGPEGQFLYHVLRHALRNALRNVLCRVLGVLVLHVSPKGSVGAVEDGACHNEHLYASVLRDARHVPRHVLRYVLRNVLRRVLCGLVPHVLVLHVSPKGKHGVGSAADR